MGFQVTFSEELRRRLPAAVLNRVDRQLQAIAELALYPPSPTPVWLYPEERGHFRVDGYFIGFQVDLRKQVVRVSEVATDD